MTDKERRGLDFLKRLPNHLHRFTYADVCAGINYNVGSLPISIFKTDKIARFYETEPRDASIIYRARENELYTPTRSTLALPYKTVGEISIIPEELKHRLKVFGRCNKPGESRFYSSNQYATACIEALTRGATEEQRDSVSVTVGMWKIKEPLVLAQINYSEKYLTELFKHDEEHYGQMIKLTKSLNNHYLEIAKKDKFSPDYTVELFSILADEFAKIDIKSDSDYMISNYYCDQIFDHTVIGDNSTMVDAILYPSVLNAYREWNLVLHPRAMKKIEFVSAMMVWVIRRDKSVEFIPMEQWAKADEKGKICWQRWG